MPAFNFITAAKQAMQVIKEPTAESIVAAKEHFKAVCDQPHTFPADEQNEAIIASFRAEIEQDCPEPGDRIVTAFVLYLSKVVENKEPEELLVTILIYFPLIYSFIEQYEQHENKSA